MIPISTTHWQGPSWKKSYAEAIQDPLTLLQMLKLPDSYLPAAKVAAELFPLRVPKEFIAKMRLSDPDDPLLLQVLPLHAESIEDPRYTKDPVGDLSATATPGLIHKYHGRVLLMLTGACAVHCRYCFRRHFPYSDNAVTDVSWSNLVHYIRADKTISEVIFSGGDPLSLSDKRLADMIKSLQTIGHLKRLRIHTRLPVMIPSRLSADLLKILANCQLKVILVLHINHAQEIDAELIRKCNQLSKIGVQLLNQSVLLRRINDNCAALVDLSEALFGAGILPYYLHFLDKVQAATHFEVAEFRAQKLWSQINA
ncbi:MAG: EF-P beta-lysylation protein EpmB, partial [Thiohalomonadales bacterium]